MRATVSSVIVIALLVTAVAASRGHAQESQSILPALLTEVRGLRAAMEQMASAGPRVQLALGRLQLQEQRINTLVRRLETIRDNLATAQREVAAHQGQLTQFEGVLRGNSTPAEERASVEHMVSTFKSSLAVASAEVQRLTAEETTVAGEITSEQARWMDFNQRLEELERALGRR
jgi:chromosome segregation ATPase